jgi:flagellar biosynthesis protein
MSDNPKRPDFAVALRYDGKNAPKVTAKGEGALAEQIRQVADEHGVPLHEDAALTYVLSQIDLGDQIPEFLYRAVAEVIAFAYLLSGRVCGVPTSTRERQEILQLPGTGDSDSDIP